MKKILPIVAMLTVLATPPARAAETTYAYDPLHTQVLFSVDHMGFTNVHGRFTKFKGSFTLDEQNPEAATAHITIDAASIDLPDNVWNEHTRDKFLESAKFPEITFKSTKVVRTGDKTANLTGDLTLHGVTKPVTLNATLNKIGMHPMMQGQKDAGFTVTGLIKRSDFGIAAFIPMVGDEIKLTIEVDGMYQDGSKLNK